MTDTESAGATATRGRDFTRAVPIGLALFGAIIAAVWWLPQTLLAVLMVAGILGVTELRTRFDGGNGHLMRVPLYGCSVLMPVAAYVYGLPGLLVVFASGIGVVFGVRMFRGEADFVKDVSANIFVLSYVPLLLSFMAMLIRPTGDRVALDGQPLAWQAIIDPVAADPNHSGALRLIILLTLNVVADTFALVIGMAIGRNPLAPLVSPKKTWEGLIGSLLFTAAAGSWLLPALLHHPWWQGALMGVVAAGVAASGDLVESMIKRDLGVKDMSEMIPGHGGIMDRLDSILPNAFAMWLMFAVIL